MQDRLSVSGLINHQLLKLVSIQLMMCTCLQEQRNLLQERVDEMNQCFKDYDKELAQERRRSELMESQLKTSVVGAH